MPRREMIFRRGFLRLEARFQLSGQGPVAGGFGRRARECGQLRICEAFLRLFGVHGNKRCQLRAPGWTECKSSRWTTIIAVKSEKMTFGANFSYFAAGWRPQGAAGGEGAEARPMPASHCPGMETGWSLASPSTPPGPLQTAFGRPGDRTPGSWRRCDRRYRPEDPRSSPSWCRWRRRKSLGECPPARAPSAGR